jgi:hypothetical protein
MDFPIYAHDDNGFNCNIASEFSVNYTKNDVLDNLCLFKMDRIIQYIVFLVFHGKSTTFFKQLVKKIREITEVEHKIGKSFEFSR